MVERRNRRDWRATVAADLARPYGGVVHRGELRRHGISRDDVRTEVDAGRWERQGRHTVRVLAVDGGPSARFWRAVWESGSDAALDGPAALVAGGMTGFELRTIDVTLPEGRRAYPVTGLPVVRWHRTRGRLPVVGAGVPRVVPAVATIRAAQWASSDRQAALLICLPVQQRLVTPDALRSAWANITRSRRRDFLERVVTDVVDGAHSLGELDVARLCRTYGLPEPSRQAVCRGREGRVYLDLLWRDVGLVVEVDGGHHFRALTPVEDSLRQNELVVEGKVVIRIPVIGLRLAEAAFMSQVARAHHRLLGELHRRQSA